MISLSGEGPQVFECLKCKASESLTRFSVKSGGVFCEGCKHSATDAERISTSALYTLQFIISSRVEKLYSFTVTPEVLRELRSILDRYREAYVEHSFKSLELLKIL